VSSAVWRCGAVTVHLGEKSGKYPDGNQVLVQGSEARVAFDTPQVANRIGPAFDEVDAVILGHVHEDHMAGLHRLPKAGVQVHEADLAAAQSWAGLSRHYGYPDEVLKPLKAKIEEQFHYQPRPDATAYADGQVWALGSGVRIRAHHLPGHTAGHCALVVESEGVAFIGDIDLTGFGPYYGDATSNLGQFRRSLRQVRELDAQAWVTSHHKGVVTERAQFEQLLQAFEAKLTQRSERIMQLLQEAPLSLAELVRSRVVYPPAAQELWVDCAEARSIAMHLEELVAQGQVREAAPGLYAKA
jgi:glyoxylase-like metal-dependent hydrolase (beta-lactamase superfamily II)